MLSSDAVVVLAGVSAAVDAALAVEAWRLGCGDAAELVVGLAQQEARLSAARLRVLAEAADRRVGAGSGFVTTGSWYSAATRCRVREAGPAVELATALTGALAPTGEALAAGRISEAHAGVVHRVMGRVTKALTGSVLAPTGMDPQTVATTEADAQAFLVDQATRLDPDQLAVAGRHLVARLTTPEAHDADARAADAALAELGVSLVQTDHGPWVLHGLVGEVEGARLSAALDPLMAPRPAGPDGTRDLRSARQRRGEALGMLADQAMAGPTEAGTASRARLTVTVDAATLLAPWARGAAPGEVTVPGCGDAHGSHPLSPATLEALACDAEVVPVLFAPDGSVLDVGRAQYAFPERTRRAVVARDKGCTFPHHYGRPPAWCQVHHLIPYSQGGVTSERNGALVCTPAHAFAHRHHWTAHLTGGHVTWEPPPRASRGSSGAGDAGGLEIQQPPPWKPALDTTIRAWQHRLHPPDALERDTG